jgi:2-phospho-L-lactate guanylyltransferase
MAERVLEAGRPFAVVVVTADPEVREWAMAQSVGVIDDPGSLDAAATAGRDHFAAAGCVRVVVAHADLPRARSLAALAVDGSRPTVAVVPCHRDDGSNVLSVPVDVPFRFAYGPGSFRRHVAHARGLGLGVRVVRDPDLTIDVDGLDDLHHLDGTPAECTPLRPAHVPG